MCQIVCIADREADIYDIYNEASRFHSQAKWLIRAVKNRPLINESGRVLLASFGILSVISQSVNIVPLNFLVEALNLRVKLFKEFGLKPFVYIPPIGRRGKLRMKPVFVNGVIVTETNSPIGEKPIEWLLLTNLKIDSAEKRLAILQYYVCRWQVEVFFRILKSGCKAEKLQLTCEKRYSPCLALYLIIAWRILYLTLLSRFDPNKNCELFFSTLEWQTDYLITKRGKPPNQPPSIAAVVLMVARFGGFLNRKRDKLPGPTAIWIGLQRLKDFTLAARAFRTYG